MIWFATDTNLPHIWDIWAAMVAPLNSGTDEALLEYLLAQALYTWREAFIGFVLGGTLGIGLSIAFVHSSLVERTLSPYVIASQTIPIVALAPMIVFFVGHNMTSVVLIATYLSFFPVTIAMMRGLRSPDPRALELMRSYAAGRRAVLWKLRLAGIPALPVHRPQDHRHRKHRRGDRRGGTGGHPVWPRSGDPVLQPAVHDCAREAVVRDHRHGWARNRLLRDRADRRAAGAAPLAGRLRGMTEFGSPSGRQPGQRRQDLRGRINHDRGPQ